MVCPDANSTACTELFYDRANSTEFTSLVKELAPPGDLQRCTIILLDAEFRCLS